MPSSLSTFLFDLDGTLIDSIDLIFSSYRHTLQTHRGEIPPDSTWLSGLGRPLRHQFRSFTDDADEIEAMVDTYREHNHANHDAMVQRFPGTLEAIETLKQRGCKLGVVTSKMRNGTGRGLRHCGFEGLFDAVVAADDVEEPKPHPEPVLRALELLAASPDDAVFIGDSPHDLAAGRAAGVRTGAVLWGPFDRATLARHAPDYWLEDVADIVQLA